MPIPSVDPMPRPSSDDRLLEPLDAQDASYFAASASTASFLCRSIQPQSLLERCQRSGAHFAYALRRSTSGARDLVVVERAIRIRAAVVACQLFERIRRRGLQLVLRQVDHVRAFAFIVVQRGP